ncbi:hypothetical protein KL86DYS2_10810 [uncultured Dysgonomonas sp.]|uniref:Uncharacterized protein n=1 Tax=uncultured Dysgonomonas sp. TaxID=206096 RepID=A0A212J635_9BACT|nr:hypothetical protein KL86DYS2_10810 [uncultured Dysgonomonas sp.]
MNQTIIYHVLSEESLDKKLKEILLTKEESLIERYHGVIMTIAILRRRCH